MASRPRPIHVCTCVFVLASFASAAELPDATAFEGKPITGVRFEPPHQPISADELASLVGIKKGQPLGANALRAAIKKLYASGLYANVEVDGEPSADGVVLIFRTQDQWFIGPVEVRGNTKNPPNRGQMANATRLELGQPFDDAELDSATAGLQRLLARNGFYEASVQKDQDRDAEHDQIAFTFTIKSGKRARLTTPVITGDPRMPVEKVASATKYKGWFRWKLDTQENVQ